MKFGPGTKMYRMIKRALSGLLIRVLGQLTDQYHETTVVFTVRRGYSKVTDALTVHTKTIRPEHFADVQQILTSADWKKILALSEFAETEHHLHNRQMRALLLKLEGGETGEYFEVTRHHKGRINRLLVAAKLPYQIAPFDREQHYQRAPYVMAKLS